MGSSFAISESLRFLRRVDRLLRANLVSDNGLLFRFPLRNRAISDALVDTQPDMRFVDDSEGYLQR